jgi:hypothetical protein
MLFIYQVWHDASKLTLIWMHDLILLFSAQSLWVMSMLVVFGSVDWT